MNSAKKPQTATLTPMIPIIYSRSGRRTCRLGYIAARPRTTGSLTSTLLLISLPASFRSFPFTRSAMMLECTLRVILHNGIVFIYNVPPHHRLFSFALFSLCAVFIFVTFSRSPSLTEPQQSNPLFITFHDERPLEEYLTREKWGDFNTMYNVSTKSIFTKTSEYMYVRRTDDNTSQVRIFNC